MLLTSRATCSILIVPAWQLAFLAVGFGYPAPTRIRGDAYNNDLLIVGGAWFLYMLWQVCWARVVGEVLVIWTHFSRVELTLNKVRITIHTVRMTRGNLYSVHATDETHGRDLAVCQTWNGARRVAQRIAEVLALGPIEL